MPAKFTHGGHNTGTHTIQKGKVAEPPTKNTMHGMPGHIKTGQTAASGGMKGGKGEGPKREGPVGKRGSSGPFPKTAPGTITKSYHADSTGHPGRVEKLAGKGRTSFEGRRKSTMY